MIRRWYEVTCDNEECGIAIGHYAGNQYTSLQQAVDDGALIKYIGNKRLIFCCEECYKKYLRDLKQEGEG